MFYVFTCYESISWLNIMDEHYLNLHGIQYFNIYWDTNIIDM